MSTPIICYLELSLNLGVFAYHSLEHTDFNPYSHGDLVLVSHVKRYISCGCPRRGLTLTTMGHREQLVAGLMLDDERDTIQKSNF
jgi:hypothetical protein